MARTALHVTAQTTTLHHLKRIIVVVPLFLPRGNWSFDSGKNNGVVAAKRYVYLRLKSNEQIPDTILTFERDVFLMHPMLTMSERANQVRPMDC